MSLFYSAGQFGAAIPDTSMFQSPLYQFWAGDLSASDGTTVEFPEVLDSNVADATVSEGSPEKTTISSKPAIAFDDGEGDGIDGHTWSPDADLPTGADSFSIAVVAYKGTLDGQRDTIIHWGQNSDEQRNQFRLNNKSVSHDFFANSNTGSTTIPQGSFFTMGVRYDGNNRKLYLDGAGDGTDTPGSVNVQDANHSIGYVATNNSNPLTGSVREIVVSGAAESDQAFSDFHTDRLG